MDRAVVDLLLTAEGQQLLSCLPRPYDPRVALSLSATLRERGHSPDLVAAALTQSELRQRAERKFGEHAHRMLFTRDGLEQSSRPAVADLHGQRLVEAGVHAVHDLGCGIGSDARAFARAGMSVDAVESDAATAAIAAHNLSELALSTVAGAGTASGPDDVRGGPGRVRVHHGSAEDPRWLRESLRRSLGRTGGRGSGTAGSAVWLDPGRRIPGVADSSGRTRRTRSPTQMSPPWELVKAIAGQWP
ncbi:MAG: hypothetical protein WA892_06880, partial [Ornithinimicrobium sp.]